MIGKKEEKSLQDIKATTLFLVPTPIGNLRDITLRALDVLQAVDLIACEDTRHTRKLLSAHGISKPLISYEKFSEASKTSRILRELSLGKSIALVSDAGTPLISDPGSVLVAKAREMGVQVISLPGACAAVTALSSSGFDGPFRFIGFLPRQKRAAEMELAKMHFSSDHQIFYESPHRILATLDMMHSVMPDRIICLAREISKMHEEYIIGPVREVVDALKDRDILGEITVVVKGGSESADEMDEVSLEKQARDLMKAGYSKKDLVRILSDQTGMGRNKVYQFLLSIH